MELDNMDFLDKEAYCGSDFDLDTVKTKPVWECKDGTLLIIEDMSTTHIKNCIDMIKRSIRLYKQGIIEAPWRTSYLSVLRKEYDNRMFLEAMRNMSDEQFNKIIHKRQ